MTWQENFVISLPPIPPIKNALFVYKYNSVLEISSCSPLYTAKNPVLSLHSKSGKLYQTDMAGFRSEHLRCRRFAEGMKALSPCNCSLPASLAYPLDCIDVCFRQLSVERDGVYVSRLWGCLFDLM